MGRNFLLSITLSQFDAVLFDLDGGGFGLVVGIDRKGDPDALQKNGAHIVVQDLSELL